MSSGYKNLGIDASLIDGIFVNDAAIGDAKALAYNSATNTITYQSFGTGSGSVTSVGLSLPSFITVSGSPVTTSGTLTGTLATQVANTVFGGPATGADAAPTFRALVSADLPLADATHIGAVSTTTQTFAGNKTFTGTISASNLSGTNTGDITLAAVGSTPSTNGASLSGQVLTLQPADETHPGLMTTGTQTFAGDKNLTGTFNFLNAGSQIITRGLIALYGATQGTEGNGIFIKAPADPSAQYTITLPTAAPASNMALMYDGADYVWGSTFSSGTFLSGIKFTASSPGAGQTYTLDNYFRSAEADIASTITWAGTTAPSSLDSGSYRWWRIGNAVTVLFRIRYTVAGLANTSVSIEKPSDLPNMDFSQHHATGEFEFTGAASIAANHLDPIGSSNATIYYGNPGGTDTFKIIPAVAVAATFVVAQVTYLCADN